MSNNLKKGERVMVYDKLYSNGMGRKFSVIKPQNCNGFVKVIDRFGNMALFHKCQCIRLVKRPKSKMEVK